MTKDPVCGMAIDEQKAAATVTYDGKTYYFCSGVCQVKFEQYPLLYIDIRLGAPRRA